VHSSSARSDPIISKSILTPPSFVAKSLQAHDGTVMRSSTVLQLFLAMLILYPPIHVISSFPSYYPGSINPVCIIVHLNTMKVEACQYPSHPSCPCDHPCKAVQKAKQMNMCSAVAHGAFTASADLLVGSVGSFNRTKRRRSWNHIWYCICFYFRSAKMSLSHHSSVVAG
jgi:hypothetical protein